MAEVVHDTQHEFWHPAVELEGAPTEIVVPPAPSAMAETCPRCQTEFMIGARFCHTCGAHRPQSNAVSTTASSGMAARAGRAALEFAAGRLAWLWSATRELYKHLEFPGWLRYLHFHEIKSRIGLPMPSLIAFMIGLGCVGWVIGVSLFYKASNFTEFEAIQMWRIELLLAATASFVAGILLKKPSGD
jgi:hypothetical protein